MQLSPLNLSGLLTTLQAQACGTTPAANPKERRNRALECWRCPECREVYDWEDEAEECCAEPAPAVTSQPTCPVCAAEYTSHRDAADCCLWKDLDAPTRWRMADAVEAGSTWADQIAKHAQVRMIGNSVCPPVAEALVRANYVERPALRKAA